MHNNYDHMFCLVITLSFSSQDKTVTTEKLQDQLQMVRMQISFFVFHIFLTRSMLGDVKLMFHIFCCRCHPMLRKRQRPLSLKENSWRLWMRRLPPKRSWAAAKKVWRNCRSCCRWGTSKIALNSENRKTFRLNKNKLLVFFCAKI